MRWQSVKAIKQIMQQHLHIQLELKVESRRKYFTYFTVLMRSHIWRQQTMQTCLSSFIIRMRLIESMSIRTYVYVASYDKCIVRSCSTLKVPVEFDITLLSLYERLVILLRKSICVYARCVSPEIKHSRDRMSVWSQYCISMMCK